jgi:hypothetical protein
MTHDEYLSRRDGFTDSAGDVGEVLRHASSCAACRKDRRLAERALSRLDSGRRSAVEELARFGATAAFLAAVVIGLHWKSVRTEGPAREPQPRYRIVGDASGVVAYTPGGVVVGVASESSQGRGVSR